MSIGNLKDTGNQGNNLPFQWKVLQGLQEIANQVSQPLTCVDDSIKICDANGDTLNINANGSINTVIQNAAGTSVTTTTVGADVGLDVNIINSLPLEVNITEANDSILVYGWDGTTNRKIKTDAAGELQVDILSLPNEGQQTMANSISVALASDQLGIARTTGIIRPTGAGNVNTVPVSGRFFSVSVANVGAANGSLLGVANSIKPGEVLNFSADAVNNYFTTFAYDATGTEFIIIFVY
jgi:hypothetical protein